MVVWAWAANAQNVGNMASQNMQNSSHLQGVKGAFEPAPSPFGKTSSLSENSGTKVAGFWGGAAGTAVGGALGSAFGPLGTMAGSAIGGAAGHWLGDKVSGNGGLATGPNKNYKAIGQMASQNMQNSAYLQGVRGAFAPAPNPWGTGQQQ